MADDPSRTVTASALPCSSSSQMSDEDRLKLAHKLDGELDDFIGKLPRKPYTEGFTIDNMDEEMQNHPAFRTDPIEDDGRELPPLIEAMRQLKYDTEENSAEELAANYKDDGNYNFKLKKYRWAVDAYTAGIRVRCNDGQLNAQLLSNRAAANYHLGNYKSAFDDCKRAVEVMPNHMKAIVRGAQCCLQMRSYDEAISWAEKGLKISSEDASLLDIMRQSLKQKKVEDRNKRKALYEENREKQKENELLDAIEKRGIRVAAASADGSLDLEALEPRLPMALGSKVHLEPDGRLVWPVLFVYPEHAQTDFVQNFGEDETFVAHLDEMFGPDVERPPWDKDGKYRTGSLQVYFEDVQCNLWQVDPRSRLDKILMHPGYEVAGGTPSFIVLVRGSPFLQTFLNRCSTSVQKA